MWSWLNGPGKVFKDPLPGSTNYLSAYDADGNLLRLNRDRDTPDTKGAKDIAGEITDPESADELRVRSKDEEGAEEAAVETKLGREMEQDLRPFPLNRHFVSQPVLSEQLRDAIYKRVVRNGEKIVSVSSSLGVSMERVAAVVRLKEVEKKWVNEVRIYAASTLLECIDLPLFSEQVMRLQKIRLVFKTPTWLQKFPISDPSTNNAYHFAFLLHP